VKRDGIAGICKDQKTEDAFRKVITETHARAKRGVYFDDYVRLSLEAMREEMREERRRQGKPQAQG
jgi:hypothetical protein